MGLFNRKKEVRALQSEMAKMIVGYSPAFSTYSGGLYEMDLTVSAINAFATHCSKANPKIKGTAYNNLQKQFEVYMNDTMTTQQFLYRLATIYACENNAFILPITDQYHMIIGYYPISTIGSSITMINGELVLKYYLENKEYFIPYAEVGHMKNHQYKSEFYGSSNAALSPTMQLLDTQNQGIANGIKQSAMIRFLAKIGTLQRDEDIGKLRDAFSMTNLSTENTGGVAFYDTRITDLKQIESKPFIVDADQANYIRTNVYNYTGVNEKILQNNYSEDEWGSFYEGKVEPFLLQLSQVQTKMTFTNREIAFGNYWIYESTRLQHASTAVKVSLITQMFDRGFMTHNQGLEILNLPNIGEEGNQYYIRLEYANINDLGKDKATEPPVEPQKDDKTSEVKDENV